MQKLKCRDDINNIGIEKQKKLETDVELVTRVYIARFKSYE